MNLAIDASLFHLIASVVYFGQIYADGTNPNFANWIVWMMLSGLISVTFWKASKDALMTAPLFVGWAVCSAVCLYCLCFGSFVDMDSYGYTILFLCPIIYVIWKKTGSPTYINIFAALMLILAFVPIISGVWDGAHKEKALPWFLWTIAYVITTVNVVFRRDVTRSDWWLLLVTPVVAVILHAMMFLLVQGTILSTVKISLSNIMKASASAGKAIAPTNVEGLKVVVFSPSTGHGVVFDKDGQARYLMDIKKVDQPQSLKNVDFGSWLQKSSDLKTIPAGEYPYRGAYNTMLLENFKSTTCTK